MKPYIPDPYTLICSSSNSINSYRPMHKITTLPLWLKDPQEWALTSSPRAKECAKR